MRYSRLQLFTFLGLFYFNLPLLLAQTDSLRTGEYYRQAETFLLKGKPDRAIKNFRKVLKANNKLSAAWRGLGIAFELLEQYDSTVIQYENVLALNPNFSRVLYYELGRAYYRNGQYQKALNYFYQFQKLQTLPLQKYGFNGEKEQRFEAQYLEELPQSIRTCKNALELINFSTVKYIQNLGDSINTANNEYFPYVSNDQQLLFYTASTLDKLKRVALDENIYYSSANKIWGKGKLVNELITSPKNEGMSTFTRDGQMMIYTICEQEGVIANGCDLRKAIMQGDSVITIEELEGRINSEFWEGQAALSCDGNQLFFASNRKGGLGSTDIWMSEKLPDGNWGTAKNLGNNINTSGDEEAPFITNDGKTLFFSSTGHLGMGEQDIFMSHWNKEGYWEAAINLGPPINTAARELGFFLTSDNQTGYFASDKAEGFGGMDIYKFQMPNEFEVAPTTFVEGFVKDSITKLPIETYMETNLRGRVKTDKNGRFFFCLPAKKRLSINIHQDDYFPHQSSQHIPQWDNQSLYPINIYLQPKSISSVDTLIKLIPKDSISPKVKPVFHTIYFRFNDFGISPEATKQLDQLVTALDLSIYQKVSIYGYADTIGASNYNLDLSKKRAQNVAQYLRLNGLTTTAVIVLGKGENNQYDKKRLNRRVEIQLE